MKVVPFSLQWRTLGLSVGGAWFPEIRLRVFLGKKLPRQPTEMYFRGLTIDLILSTLIFRPSATKLGRGLPYGVTSASSLSCRTPPHHLQPPLSDPPPGWPPLAWHPALHCHRMVYDHVMDGRGRSAFTLTKRVLVNGSLSLRVLHIFEFTVPLTSLSEHKSCN